MISKRDFPKWFLPGLLFMGTAVLVWAMPYFSQTPLIKEIEQFAFTVGEGYERWFSQQQTSNPLFLLGLSFAGGLVASISPCILSLLPVNLSYIGTREITSRKDAVVKASSFVFGVVTVLSLLGLFSSFAGIVLVKFRGYFHIGVGILIMVMGLSLAGLIHLPLPPSPTGGAIRTTSPVSEPWASFRGRIRVLLTGPYGVGLTFALVSSPCTSPVMVAVLAAAAATGSQLQSTLVMVCYALGYTVIIFLASLFTGLAKQTRSLLVHSQTVIRIASVILLAIGGFYLINGLRWVLAILN
jgi:cytochrome c-type biogenesis protein